MEKCIELFGRLDLYPPGYYGRVHVSWFEIFVQKALYVHCDAPLTGTCALHQAQYCFQELTTAERALECLTIVSSCCSLEAELDLSTRKLLLLLFCLLLILDGLHELCITNLWIGLRAFETFSQTF